MFIYFCYSPSLLQFKLWSISSYQISWSVSRRLLKMGLPIGAQYTFEAGAFSTAAIIIGWCGVKQLAAHQIVIGVSSLTFMMVLGLASAASIRIGEAVGLKETGRVREIANIVFLLTIVLMSITGILFFVLRSALPGWYIQDSEVIFWAKRLMIVAAFYQISDGLQCAVIGVLRGLEDVKVPTLTAVLGYWVVGLPIGYLLCFSFNLTSLGIWIGLSIGLTAVAVYLMYRFYYVKLKEYS